MIQVLGYPLDQAIAALNDCGYQVSVKEASCRKGPVGDDKRVIRQKEVGDRSVQLTFAAFLTQVDT